MEKAITITHLVLATAAICLTVIVPVLGGLFSIMKSINQTNTRLDHIEKNQDNTSGAISRIPAMESRLRSLEQTRSDQLPHNIQLIQTLSSIDAKLDAHAGRMKSFETKFDRKFELYDLQRSEFFEKYSHLLK